METFHDGRTDLKQNLCYQRFCKLSFDLFKCQYIWACGLNKCGLN